MATLYVENVPDDIYDAIRRQAKDNHRSIASEILLLLESSFVTERELQNRREFLSYVRSIQVGRRSARKFPSTEEMIREDRER
ncbi:MAG: FitA-like ribbon-helix-helix domain-containing protein [Candidatus Acidiferrales bacterium]